MPLPDTPEVWAFRTENVLNLRFMLCFLAVICPKEFFITAGSIKDVLSDQKKEEDLQIFEEIIFQIKDFFIHRNLDGKSLFRVLSKQAQKYFSDKSKDSLNTSNEFNYSQYKDELLCKVFELVFVVAFFCKESSHRSQCIFDKAINNLSDSSQSASAEWIKKNQHSPEMKKEQSTPQPNEEPLAQASKHEVNSLLTKSVI